MTSPTKAFYATTMVAVFLLGALVAIPAGEAQTLPKPTFSIRVSKAINDPLVPVSGTGQLEVEYTYELTQQAQTPFGVQGSVTVTIDVDCGPNVVVTGDTTDVFAIPPNPEANSFSRTEQIAKQITINRQATALEPITCNVEGTASEIEARSIPAPPAQSTVTSIKPDYFGTIEAKSSGAKLRQGGPQKQIPFEIEVKNFGNGQTKVRFEIVERPGKSWQALPPDVMVLDAKDGANANGIATFTVSTPYKNGWNNDEGGFLLRLSPEYNFDSSKKGGDVDVQILARVRGVYVPTLEPLMMLGAVLGSAMLARMVRREE